MESANRTSRPQRSSSFATLLPRAKSAAQGRWLELISALTSCPVDTFDGRKKPCPKCGGNNRFRAFDDINQEGGVVCSQCHDKNNRDGFATIQWLNGWSFPDTVRAVAERLGLVDYNSGPRPAVVLPEIQKPATNQGKGSSAIASTATKPAADSALEFQQWNDSLAAIWCMKKKPITVDALKAFGARIAKYKGRYVVIALPIWGPQLDQAEPVGWIVYNATGGTLPSKDGQVPKKATWGSKPGVVGPVDRLRDKSTHKIKTEGPTDGLAILPLVDQTKAVFCNAYGANENPDKEELNWLPSLVEGSPSFVSIGDADKAGEDGVAKWSNYFAQFGQSSIVRLPYEVVPSHGKDLRDFLNEGNGRTELEALFAAAEVVKFVPPAAKRALESPEDPHRLARANLEAYRTEHGGELRYWRGQWLKWKRNRYQFLTKEEIDAKVNARIKLEFDKQWEVDHAKHLELCATDPDYDKEPPNARKVTAPIVRDTLAALRSLCTISSTVDMGTWIQGKEKRKYLACKNCVIDTNAFLEDAPPEKIFLEHSPNWFSSNCLDYDFDPTASCPIWLQVLSEMIGDQPGKMELAQEFVGYILSPTNNRSKFLALEGQGGNGKGLFTNAILAIVGRENTSSVGLNELGKRFQAFPTLGKMVNFCGEANEIEGAESYLKNFTGGNPMMFENKGTPAFEAMPTAKLILSWNNAPRFKDRSDGLWRRLLVLRFNNKPVKPNTAMLEPEFWKANGQLPGMLNWALAGLKRLEARGAFIETEESKQASEEIRQANNSARLFIKQSYYERDGAITPVKDVYEAYVKWCNENGMCAMNAIHFGREVNQAFDNSSVERKQKVVPLLGRVWCYVNLETGSQEEQDAEAF